MSPSPCASESGERSIRSTFDPGSKIRENDTDSTLLGSSLTVPGVVVDSESDGVMSSVIVPSSRSLVPRGVSSRFRGSSHPSLLTTMTSCRRT